MRPIGCELRDVCFVHWPVDPDVLETRLPHALSVATREGVGWISLLGKRTRPMAGPVGLPGAFAQVTVRTYVRANGEDAVHFLRVDTDSRLAAGAARSIFGIPFRRVDASVEVGADDVRVRTCTPGGDVVFDATFDRTGAPGSADDDPLIGWLTDRSTFALDDGRTGTVDHDPWAVARTDVDVRTDELLASEGLAAEAVTPRFRYSPGAAFELRSWPSGPRGDDRPA